VDGRRTGVEGCGEEKISCLTGVRTLDRPARGESLYRLHNLGSYLLTSEFENPIRIIQLPGAEFRLSTLQSISEAVSFIYLYMLCFKMSCVYCCACLVCIVVSCLVCIVVNCLVRIVVSCLVCIVVILCVFAILCVY